MEKNLYMCQKIAQNMYRITITKTPIRVDKEPYVCMNIALYMKENSPLYMERNCVYILYICLYICKESYIYMERVLPNANATCNQSGVGVDADEKKKTRPTFVGNEHYVHAGAESDLSIFRKLVLNMEDICRKITLYMYSYLWG